MTGPADDLDRIMEVMSAAFDPTYGEAWTRRQVEDALLFGSTHYLVVGPDGQVPEPDGSCAGFFLSRTGFEEEELLLLGVKPEFRRRGLALGLLEQLKNGARSRGARRLLLEMRRGNPAEWLYSLFGFQPIGNRPDYYRTPDGGRIDAITFSCPLG